MLRDILRKSISDILNRARQTLTYRVTIMASTIQSEPKEEVKVTEEKCESTAEKCEATAVKCESTTEKRPLDDTEKGPEKKRVKGHTENGYIPFKKKKMALFLVYSGKGYMGMQRNPGVRTIESDLNEALLKAGVVNEEHASNPGSKMHFQRAARTDKGVSAAGQLCSLNMFVDVDNHKEKINSHLEEKIRVVGIEKTTKKFDSKNAADARTYMYMLPTFAFTPYQKFVLDNFKITDEIHQKINDTLALFKGTHNFHNFTSGKKPNDPSAKRYIIDFSMGTPFDKGGVEYAVITVKGQSFMLHQIRKMIGITIAIVRGLTDVSAIERAWGPNKCDVPKAPGLGLVLDRVHYDNYNKKYGGDGFHEPLHWEKYQTEIEEFKNKHIYPTIVDTEKEEKSMMKWMATLHLHNFENFLDHSNNFGRKATGVMQAALQVSRDTEERLQKASAEPSPDKETETTKVTPGDDVKETSDSAPKTEENRVGESVANVTPESTTESTTNAESTESPSKTESSDVNVADQQNGDSAKTETIGQSS